MNASHNLIFLATPRSGLIVITTCSPRNYDLVKSLHADAIFDYNDPACGRKIREHTSNDLFYAFDCISTDSSVRICADALSTSSSSSGAKKHYCSLLGVPNFPRKDAEKKTTLAYSAMGEDISFHGQGSIIPPKIPAREEDARFMKSFIETVDGLLGEGKVRVHPPSVRERGLQGVLDGLQTMREGRVSGEKLIYRVADTV